MKKNYIMITAIALTTLLTLSGCGGKPNEVHSVRVSETKNDVTIKETDTNNFSNSSSSISEAINTNSTTNTQQSEESTLASVSSSFASAESEVSQPDPNTPYAIDLEDTASPLTFQMKGANVPSAITLTQNGTTTITFGAQNPAYNSEYSAVINTIPTKEVQLFSYNGNAVRTVKVNTQVTLFDKISGAGAQHTGEVLYAFTNANGGLSLATPNYAGNVSADQQNVLLEAVQ